MNNTTNNYYSLLFAFNLFATAENHIFFLHVFQDLVVNNCLSVSLMKLGNVGCGYFVGFFPFLTGHVTARMSRRGAFFIILGACESFYYTHAAAPFMP